MCSLWFYHVIQFLSFDVAWEYFHPGPDSPNHLETRLRMTVLVGQIAYCPVERLHGVCIGRHICRCGGHVFLDISFRHLSSVLGVAVLRLIHVSCGRVRVFFVVFDDDLFLCTESIFNVDFSLIIPRRKAWGYGNGRRGSVRLSDRHTLLCASPPTVFYAI